jgi:glycosyltransferase involved in cell wall biosynthesis
VGQRGHMGDMRERKTLLVLIPVHNEEKNIRGVLEQMALHRIQDTADILVINDASEDDLAQMVRNWPVHVLTNTERMGYGTSLQIGYRYAVRNGYRYVIQMDGDGQHDVCNIRPIYQRLQEAGSDGEYPDIVLASRFMEGSTEFPVIFLKRVAFWWFRFLIRIITKRRIADPTTGLQGLSERAFAYYGERGHFDDRYPDANMVIQMLLLGFHIAEIPAVMHARKEGRSMHRGVQTFWYMCRMSFEIPAVVWRVRNEKRLRWRG